MKSNSLKIITACLLFGVAVATIRILVVGRALLIPLVIAIMIWYLINVLSVAYHKIPFFSRHLPWSVSYAAAILTILLILWGLFSLITGNIAEVVKAAPTYQDKLVKLAKQGVDIMGLERTPTVSQVLDSINLGRIIPEFAAAITGIAGNFGIILLYILFLLLEQNSFDKKISALIKDEQREQTVRSMIRRIDSDIRRYIGIKTLMSVLTGFFSYLILTYVGVDFAIFWAALIFIFNYIPTIGSILATVFPSLLTLIQFDTFYPFFVVIFGISGLQFLIGNILEPKVMGNSLNLSPLGIILSLTLWGSMWGFAGMFLCVPIMVILTIILAHFPQTRPFAIIMSKNGQIK